MCRFKLLDLQEHLLLDIVCKTCLYRFLNTWGVRSRVGQTHATDNDCFASDPVEDAEETDIPLSSVSIGGGPPYNLRFANDIDLLAGLEELLLSSVASHHGSASDLQLVYSVRARQIASTSTLLNRPLARITPMLYCRGRAETDTGPNLPRCKVAASRTSLSFCTIFWP